jgi:hypothetical protein
MQMTVPVEETEHKLEEALEVSIRSLGSEADRETLYKRLFALIDHDDPEVQRQALWRLYSAFHAEAGEDKDEQPPDRITLRARLASLLAGLLEPFCARFTPYLCDETAIAQIRDWLEHLHSLGDSCPVPPHILLAAHILYGTYGTTWAEAGERLMAALDHAYLPVQACAAYQIGVFCTRLAPEHPKYDHWERDLEADQRATEGMAPLTYYWELIGKKEIEGSGVAGAFWYGAPKWTIDAAEWMLRLLEQAEPEPDLDYFPCNLAFTAHEWFSQDPAAIRR